MSASQKITGVLSHYDRDDFLDPLTDALKKWRDELGAQKLLTVPDETLDS